MDLLGITIFGNPVSRWLIAMGVALGAYLALVFLTRSILTRLTRFTTGTAVRWDDVVVAALGRTKGLLLLILAVSLGGVWVTLPEALSAFLRHATVIALLVQAGIWLSAGIRQWIQVQREERMADDAAAVMTMNVLGVAVRIVLWSMVLLLALDNLGVDVTALVAGLGVGGIAIALAAQNILGDLFASLSIVLDRPFVLKDFIIVGDLMGSVEEIGLKTTRVRSLSGEQLIFSNNDLLNSRVRNFGRMFERRVVFEIGVTYDTPRSALEEIPKVIHSAVEEHGDRVRFDRSHFKSYGNSALVFESVYYVLGPDYNEYMDIQQSINLRIHEAFEGRGIEFAYPTQTIFLRTADAPASA